MKKDEVYANRLGLVKLKYFTHLDQPMYSVFVAVLQTKTIQILTLNPRVVNCSQNSHDLSQPVQDSAISLTKLFLQKEPSNHPDTATINLFSPQGYLAISSW
jgi:hypothetical protein